MKKLLLIVAVIMITFTMSGCDAADRASDNLSTAADNFEILRKVVFINGITDEYLFAIEGYCSIEADTVDDQLEVTCETGKGVYEKHFLGLSDNVTYMVLQLEAVNVSTYHYRVILRPQTLIPDIEIDTE